MIMRKQANLLLQMEHILCSKVYRLVQKLVLLLWELNPVGSLSQRYEHTN
jgi:hypothetical protein